MVPQFSKKNIDSKTLGERLKEIREHNGLTVEEIANGIKVNKKYLEQIEADNYEDMPSEVYIRGFLKSYSNFLHIEPKDVLAIYDKERGIEKNIEKAKTPSLKKTSPKIPTITLSFRMVFGFLFGMFSLLVLWHFYVEANKFSATPRLLISKPLDNSIVKENSVEVVGITDIGNKITINGQPIFVNEKGEFNERVSLKEGINKLLIKATNKFDKEIEKEITLAAQYSKNIPPKNDAETNKKQPDKIKVVLKTRDNSPVWLAVKVDGKQVYNGTILPETEQEFEGLNEISITSGKANQTLIKVNQDENFKVLADISGVIRDVIFRKEKNISSPDENNNKENVKDGIDDVKQEEVIQ